MQNKTTTQQNMNRKKNDNKMEHRVDEFEKFIKKEDEIVQDENSKEN